MKFASMSLHRIVKIESDHEVVDNDDVSYRAEHFIFKDEYGDTFRLTAFLAEPAKDEEK